MEETEIREIILSSLDKTELFLNCKGLTTLPKEIGLLCVLKNLWLSGNQLKSLPAEIGQLHSLTILNLRGNKLTSLPPEIGQLRSLTTLNLRWNQLTSLPPEIGQLHSLTRLDLWRNEITSIPAEIGQLHSLNTLDLWQNQLTNLPAEIGQLQSLETLDLFHNQLTSIPTEIGQIHSLRMLQLCGNSIEDLSTLANHPNQDLEVYCFGVNLPRRYWTHSEEWKAEWLITEKNAEIRRMLLQRLGYDRIIEELGAIEIDRYREYTLLKIDADVDVEPIHLLKMTCPSTAHIHVLRVPPDLDSAREAICWINWYIDPEDFAMET